jgi:hypothetical protein
VAEQTRRPMIRAREYIVASALVLLASAANADTRTVQECQILAGHHANLALLLSQYTTAHPTAELLREAIDKIEAQLHAKHPGKRIEDICPNEV